MYILPAQLILQHRLSNNYILQTKIQKRRRKREKGKRVIKTSPLNNTNAYISNRVVHNENRSPPTKKKETVLLIGM